MTTDLKPVDTDESSCSLCGAYMEWEECGSCGGDGYIDVYEDDPMWYDPGDTEMCEQCDGKGGYWQCINVPHSEAVVMP